MEHGTRSTYNNYGCRCAACKKASNDYARIYHATGSGAQPGWGTSHGPSGYNRGCRCDICSLKVKSNRILYEYGITLEGLEKLIALQDHKCPICSRPLGDTKHVLDHSHELGRVRGVLCYACNIGLGKFQDSPILLDRALDYLSQF